MTVTVRIEGLRELQQKLRELGPKLAANGLRQSAYAGAVPIKKATIEEAPQGATGNLKNSIVIRKRQQTEKTSITYSVKIRGSTKRYKKSTYNKALGRVGQPHEMMQGAPYARFVHNGHYTRGGKKWIPPNAFMTRAVLRTWKDGNHSAIGAVKAKLQRYVIQHATGR